MNYLNTKYHYIAFFYQHYFFNWFWRVKMAEKNKEKPEIEKSTFNFWTLFKGIECFFVITQMEKGTSAI